MEEARNLEVVAFVSGKGRFEVGDRIGPDGSYAESALAGSPVQLRPHASHDLGEHGGAVVVPLEAAIVVAHHEQHRDAAVVFGSRHRLVRAVKPGEHELQGRFGREAAGLKVQHAVEHIGIGGSQHALERGGVARGELVDAGDQLLFEPASDVAAGVVVRGVGDAEPACPVNQVIARERMSQRRVIVLALGNEIEMAVLADPEIAQCAERGQVELGVRLELARGRPASRVSQPRPDLLAGLGQQMQEAMLEGGGQELKPLESRLGYGGRLFAAEKGMVGANRAHVFLAAQVRQ